MTLDYLELASGHINEIEQRAGIPAVSEWGLVVMLLLGLTAGTVMFRRVSRKAA